MAVFHATDFDDHEEVVFISDPEAGLRAIIAIHSTRRGPALGGCRIYPYASEADALSDVLRLSRGMSYKAAAANVRLGGGKSVIIADPATDKSEALLQAMGRAIAKLNGRYITGEDIGTNPSDMAVIRRETDAVSCLEPEDGGYGDPAYFTALGVLQAIRAGIEAARGSDSLRGVRVAVQGVGNVGYRLCELLAAEGAVLTICDASAERAERAAAAFGAEQVSLHEIYSAPVEVFAPCAIGSVLNDETIPQLRAEIVAGAANNQLARASHAQTLSDRGIIYVPDYIANGGGLVSCAAEWYRTDRGSIEPDVLRIFDLARQVIDQSSRLGVTTSEAADSFARERLSQPARSTREELA